MPPLDRLVTGTDAPTTLPIRESAGQLSLEIEPDTGAIRHVAWRGVEFVRMIYANVRRDNWSTIGPKVTGFAVEHSGDGFRATFDASHVAEGIDFLWRGTIEADGKGHLTYTLDGEVRKDFRTNRTGICVLHPAQLRGTRCEVGHPENGCETSRFPDLIDPTTPFTDVVSVTCEPYPGATAEIAFEGELFEMEDQRNFGDNSFKTYVYPQTKPSQRPVPYELRAGQRLRQVVRISVQGELPETTPPVAPPNLAFATPKLATIVEEAVPEGEMARLGFVRAVVRTGNLAPEMSRILLSTEAESGGDLAETLNVAFALEGPWRSGELARVEARPRYTVGGNFGDVNRNRPAPAHVEGAMWGHQPQVHLTDTRTLFESPLTFADEVRTARGFLGDGEAILGPVTMAGGHEDARWNSLVGVAWTLTVVAQAARACLDLLVLESLSRFRGTLPRLVLEDLAGYEVVGFEGTRDFVVTVLHLRKEKRGRTLVANQTPEDQLLKLREMGPTARARVLDAANVAAVSGDLSLWQAHELGAVPARLRTHAYVAIDCDL